MRNAETLKTETLKGRLERALLVNRTNLQTAQRDVRQARKDYAAVLDQLISLLESERWGCGDCGQRGEPRNLGDHNQCCAACGSRNVRLDQ